MGLATLVDRVLGWLSGARAPSVAEQFRRADLARREGRSAEARRLVDQGLKRAPNSAAGHLLSGYLHVDAGHVDLAQRAFLEVLALDPVHPRALLGLAKIAIDQGDPESARPYLNRAIEYHEDFAEARALEAALMREAAPDGPAGSTPGATRPPATDGRPWSAARDRIVARIDGAMLYAEGEAARAPALAEHLSRVARAGAATLARAGLGPLRRGVVESAQASTYLSIDADLVTSVALPAGRSAAEGWREVERLRSERAPVAQRG